MSVLLLVGLFLICAIYAWYVIDKTYKKRIDREELAAEALLSEDLIIEPSDLETVIEQPAEVVAEQQELAIKTPEPEPVKKSTYLSLAEALFVENDLDGAAYYLGKIEEGTLSELEKKLYFALCNKVSSTEEDARMNVS